LEKIKILIIGAGPAGASTSLFLSKHEIAHTIVDSAVFPRDKVCGDGIDLNAIRVLNQLDPNIAKHELKTLPEFYAIHGLRLITPSGRSSHFHYQPNGDDLNYPLIWTSKRFDFDNFLVKKLSSPFADFRQGFEVKQIVKVQLGWEVTYIYQGIESKLFAEFLVGADGDHSVVLRALQMRTIDKTHYAATIRQYWKNVNEFEPSQAIDIYIPPKLPLSYFYMFPLPNHEVNVGYGMTSALISKKKHNLRAIFKQLIQEDPVLKERFKDATPLENPIGWGLPLASLKRKAHGEGYLIIGDAASMVNPTNGEGIGIGMISGMIAAKFIKNAHSKGDFSPYQFRNFDRETTKRLKSEISLYRQVMRFKPWLFWDAAINLGGHHALTKAKFAREAKNWLITAYEKPIEINVE
jgi:menaquinone-9 beta-reductase